VSNVRRYFLQGLAVIGPLGITAYVLWWLFIEVDSVLGRWLDRFLGWSIPGIGALLLILLLVLVGWIVDRTVGRRFLRIGDRLLNRVPIVRRLYGGSSRILRAVLGEERMAFREVVLFEHPGPGLWALGLVTSHAPSIAREVLSDEGVTIYLPTAPNPMSGYLIVTDRSRVRPTKLTPEEAFTFVLSAGSVSPGRAAELLDTGRVRPAPGTAAEASGPSSAR